jgi:integrase/recombinase XerC
VEEVRASASAATGIGAELALAAGRVLAAHALSSESEPRVLSLVARFGEFLERGFELRSLAQVVPVHVETFIRAPSASGVTPSVATMRLRRSTLRLLFRTARELGILEGDPTIDVKLASRTNEAARPLTDAEVGLCRSAALEDLTSTRLSVPWALGEATARAAEIPHLRRSDLDLAGGRAWIHGSSNNDARWGQLTEWGARQLARQVDRYGGNQDDWLLAYPGRGNHESRRSHSAQAIRETLQRAGLFDDPQVRPGSLAAWAGVRVLETTGRIDAVARALGTRSLDGAARAIDWDWADAESLDE